MTDDSVKMSEIGSETSKSKPGSASSLDITNMTHEQKMQYASHLENRVMNLMGDANNGPLTRSRLQWLVGEADSRRSIYKECGYLKTSEIDIAKLHDLYEREALAARVVEVYPQESWMVSPTVYETETPTETTPFEEAFQDLDRQLMGESWYSDPEEKGSLIWSILEQLDIDTGVGDFGGLLLGINDGKDLSEPIAGINKDGSPRKDYQSSNKRELLYMRPLRHGILKVSEIDNNKSSRRYGLPLTYEIGETLTGKDIDADRSLRELQHYEVHWTRIIHVDEEAKTSRMMPVINRLWDAQKVYASSAEMYWQGAFPGIAIETHPELGTDVGFSTDTNDQLEKYINSLQRLLKLTGASAKMLAPVVVDPSPQIERYIEAICIKLGVPKKIFIGSESGERASTEEAKQWEKKLRKRRNKVITPKIIAPFINRLIMAGILPKPKSFNVTWREVDNRTDLEKAETAVRQTSAMAKYLHSGLARIMDPNDFFIKFGGMNREEAEGTLKRASKRHPNLLPEDYEGVKEDEGPTAEGKFNNIKKDKPQSSTKEDKGQESVRET